MTRWIIRLITHGIAAAIGFALGIYLLPILTAPPSPDAAMLEAQAEGAAFTAELTRDLRGSDFLHWGEGTISVTDTQIIHTGALAPGPDYMVYLTTEFVEHEDEFTPIKDQAALVGPVKTFGGFLLDLPAGVDPAAYTTVVVWCESFGEFITAGKYR
ncbi:electron transfer DM13 [Litoreibacter ponti]|uniref:Electron transfer DM13 n=1 Tax=Litoreibacter ponti TaxID=1510457 RepID=A0A2T6BEU9_9RHOB|nr:DM13 domain-containing protein [Litoreibacter ponti]PTX54569.1 electron transfer DM13 [Litoreibacter ponti]